MPSRELEIVLRSTDPRVRQVEAEGWERVATSWGARLEIDPADPEPLARLQRLVGRADSAGYVLRLAQPDDIRQLLALDGLTAPDYPGGVATRHEPLDKDAATALLQRGQVWGAWQGETLVALTVTRKLEHRVETDFTAVHPQHRGGGLGSAVKAASVLAHAGQGETHFGTGGADSNLASLAMNRAVGYQITESWHTYRRSQGDHG
ncbi:GNAT family N-acetyltransferase [Ornithinimicrobium sp. F0845]|uniref:GNAT family N-acetyltransferase n=1 Tax=Ornithinimicrobium sp. F0845 TaxID=2926412 RepID=UPI001FF63C75|nr:GNAT family N-acetyltransferase [Ornithinimicrobium sp. F0845]MCK0112948.1 GNAT family N-acetyltransferase [Ornithinimicrobium sp. F0845]